MQSTVTNYNIMSTLNSLTKNPYESPEVTILAIIPSQVIMTSDIDNPEGEDNFIWP